MQPPLAWHDRRLGPQAQDVAAAVGVSDSRAVIMLQAVAAGALGYEALQRELLRKLDPSVRDPSVRDPSVRDEPPT